MNAIELLNLNYMMIQEQNLAPGPVHLKTFQVDESGGFAGFGSAVLLGGGLIALVAFVAFFVFMTSMILKRRRALDILESGEEEVEDVSPVTMAATPMQLQPNPGRPDTCTSAGSQQAAPRSYAGRAGAGAYCFTHCSAIDCSGNSEPTPAPEDFTDAQLMAAGWSQAQILELRGSASAHGTSAALPTFNCIVTGQVWTANDAWWQCPSCGICLIGCNCTLHTLPRMQCTTLIPIKIQLLIGCFQFTTRVDSGHYPTHHRTACEISQSINWFNRVIAAVRSFTGAILVES